MTDKRNAEISGSGNDLESMEKRMRFITWFIPAVICMVFAALRIAAAI